jgi:hypothetical protein
LTDEKLFTIFTRMRTAAVRGGVGAFHDPL